MNICDDNRLELIERYKKQLVESTNIKSSPDEMAVIDNILFRFWQMGWLKEQEAVEPYMDYDGHDVWRCGNCGATIFHIEHSQADEDWKSYAKFCRQCGKKVKWDGRTQRACAIID